MEKQKYVDRLPKRMYPTNAPRYLIPNIEEEFRGELLDAAKDRGVLYIRFFEKCAINSLSEFLERMNEFYNQQLGKPEGHKYELANIQEGQLIVVNIRENTFIRGIVLKYNNLTNRITIRDADKASVFNLSADLAYNIDEIFLALSFQAVPCQLDDLEFWFHTDIFYRIFIHLVLGERIIKGKVTKIISSTPNLNGVVSLSVQLFSATSGAVNLNAEFTQTVPLVCEIKIKDGDQRRGIVSHADQYGYVWIRFEDDNRLHKLVKRSEEAFEELDASCRFQYGFENFEIFRKLYEEDENMMCMANFGPPGKGKIYRVTIIKLHPENQKIQVDVMDLGRTELVSVEQLYMLPRALKELDYIAALSYKCKMKGIRSLSQDAVDAIFRKQIPFMFTFRYRKQCLMVNIDAQPNENLPFINENTQINTFILQNFSGISDDISQLQVTERETANGGLKIPSPIARVNSPMGQSEIKKEKPPTDSDNSTSVDLNLASMKNNYGDSETGNNGSDPLDNQKFANFLDDSIGQEKPKVVFEDTPAKENLDEMDANPKEVNEQSVRRDASEREICKLCNAYIADEDEDFENDEDFNIPVVEVHHEYPEMQMFPHAGGEPVTNPYIREGVIWEFELTFVSKNGWFMMDDHVNRDLYLDMNARMESFYRKGRSLYEGLVTSDNIIDKGYYVGLFDNVFYRVKTCLGSNPNAPRDRIPVKILDLGAESIIPIKNIFPMHYALKGIPPQCYTGDIRGNSVFTQLHQQLAFLEHCKDRAYNVKIVKMVKSCDCYRLRPHLNVQFVYQRGFFDFDLLKLRNDLTNFVCNQ